MQATEGCGMNGRYAAMVILVGGIAAAPAAGQPALPPAIKPDPIEFLLPPEAPSASESRSAVQPIPPVSETNDLPPLITPKTTTPVKPNIEKSSNAARLSLPKDVVPVSAKTVEGVQRAQKPSENSVKGDELFSYLSDTPSLERSKTTKQRESEFGGRFTDSIEDALDPEAMKGRIRSDHAFDCIVSPITNPFLFEDPRSLTEIRPIFIYQKIPSPQPNFGGGEMWFFGGQGRIAIGERFSITMNKLGAFQVNSKNPVYGENTGLSEFWFGPKYTFIRDVDKGRILAAGAQFQLPVGSGDVFQNTGSLSIVPYLSYSQRFLQTKFGGFNLMASGGYSFSTNDERSEYYYLSGHLAFDIGNAHRFYPIFEMNWLQYTSNGNSRFLKGEGRDLINFGSLGKGSGLLTGAFGGRVKLSRNTELGVAYEIPFSGNKDFFDSRFTVDFIWRY